MFSLIQSLEEGPAGQLRKHAGSVSSGVVALAFIGDLSRSASIAVAVTGFASPS